MRVVWTGTVHMSNPTQYAEWVQQFEVNPAVLIRWAGAYCVVRRLEDGCTFGLDVGDRNLEAVTSRWLVVQQGKEAGREIAFGQNHCGGTIMRLAVEDCRLLLQQLGELFGDPVLYGAIDDTKETTWVSRGCTRR